MRDKTALVTGAAGGIGEAVVRALVTEGVAVAALDANAEALAAVVAELVCEGHVVRGYPVDVSSSVAVDAVVEAAEHELGPISFLVNAAGILRTSAAIALTDDDWNQTFAVNATGVFHVSRSVARRMIVRRAGAIVTVASNAASTPRWNMAAYAASKAAAAGFTRCLGLEVARFGIRCNVVAPGSTNTPMLTSLLGESSDAMRACLEGTPDQYRVGIPLGKVAEPADVADAVLFLLSQRAAHITLHDLTVDGGAALGR